MIAPSFCARMLPLLLAGTVWAGSSGGSDRVHAQARIIEEAEEVTAVLKLLADRLSLMPAVAAYKWRHGLAVFDPVREEKLLAEVGREAETLGLDAVSARALFSVQMRLAREVQEQAITRFRERGLEQIAIRDLQSVLRPQLERLGARLLEALAAALPSLQTPKLAERYADEAGRVLGPAGLAAEQRQEVLLALAELRASTWPHSQRVLARKVLRVGTTGDYAPFSSEQQGALVGVDVSLLESFARSLGISVRFVRTSWPTLMQDLGRGAFDLAASGISITPERSARAQFSIPYHHGGKTAIARCADRAQLASLVAIDQPAIRVSVNPGGTNEAFARTQLKQAQLLVFPDNRTIFAEIIAGRTDVMITDDIEVELQTRRHPELCRTTRELFMSQDKAWLLPSGSDLLDRVDRWLAPRVHSRSVERMLKRALQARR